MHFPNKILLSLLCSLPLFSHADNGVPGRVSDWQKLFSGPTLDLYVNKTTEMVSDGFSSGALFLLDKHDRSEDNLYIVAKLVVSDCKRGQGKVFSYLATGTLALTDSFSLKDDGLTDAMARELCSNH